MGLLLVRGVQSDLGGMPTDAGEAANLRVLAERIAAGDVAGIAAAPAALAHGFGWITLYGGLSVCLLAFASLVLFGVPAAG
ncbi:hypothetical protein NL298_27445, partial [Klebsiella pneumoniae]|nr:hypothetical protein [Klebsiella pneumoniae]